MRVLKVHNFYQLPGGEDISYKSEVDLLLDYGHEVRCEEFNNSSIPEDRSLLKSIKLAKSTVWSHESQSRLQKAIEDFNPDVAHFHNTFPLVSPSAYYTCRRMNVPVVQTLPNYRLLCPSATFYRDGQVCEDCLARRFAWPGILHACYQDSRSASATVAAMQSFHRLIGTWKNAVDIYIVLSNASRDLLIRGGMQPETIVVKPNFLIPDPGPGQHAGGFVLFVGRLSPEKGIGTLLEAWRHLPGRIPLMIIGDGPLAPEVDNATQQNPAVEWKGNRSVAETLQLMGDASLLIFSSEWHETFGRTMIEAYSRGTPVLASNRGAAVDMVRSGITGLHFDAGNASDLAAKVTWLFENRAELTKMGIQARAMFEQEYSAEQNYEQLLATYNLAIARNAGALNERRPT